MHQPVPNSPSLMPSPQQLRRHLLSLVATVLAVVEFAQPAKPKLLRSLPCRHHTSSPSLLQTARARIQSAAAQTHRPMSSVEFSPALSHGLSPLHEQL
ncbi:hypothetical protein M0R45_021418 [Rubus argutus]|uniref:Secreted protein n=1 Tax=Rubus argutus TaxID=59490 RepID=A0AAW1XB99_RUBAR